MLTEQIALAVVDEERSLVVLHEVVALDADFDVVAPVGVASLLAVLAGGPDELQHVVGVLVEFEHEVARDAIRDAHDARRLRVVNRSLEAERYVRLRGVEQFVVRPREALAERRRRAFEVDEYRRFASLVARFDPIDVSDIQREVVAPHSVPGGTVRRVMNVTPSGVRKARAERAPTRLGDIRHEPRKAKYADP